MDVTGSPRRVVDGYLVGSLPHGVRRPEELAPVPDPASLTQLEQKAQVALASLVAAAGGPLDSTRPVPTGSVPTLTRLLDRWARPHAKRLSIGLVFNGRPGLWHALDDLFPVQDPRRWYDLRADLTHDLERRGWERLTPPRGAVFLLPEKLAPYTRS